MGQFEAVWNSQDTNSKSQVSIWAPSMQTSLLHSNKVLGEMKESVHFISKRIFAVMNESLFLLLYFYLFFILLFLFIYCYYLFFQTRLCVGHYALLGLNSPSAKVAASRFLLIEATDDSTSRVLKTRSTSASIVNLSFPFPLRFKQVWHLTRGSKSLYAWKAVPPEGFVTLGMICTSSGE